VSRTDPSREAAQDRGPGKVVWQPTDLLDRSPRSILVVMLSALGDAVMVLPVLSALRRAFPEARISWVIQPGPAPLAEGHAGVDRVIPFQRVRGPRPGAVLRSAAALARTVREMRQVAAAESSGTFDLLLDLQVYFKAGLITLLAPARIKLGFDYPRTRDLNWLLTTHRIPPHPQRYAHVQDQYFEFLHHLGVDPEPLEYGLTLRSEERESQLRFLEKLDGPLCALVLATSKPEKDWNAEGFAEVARELRGRFGMHPVLVGGRSPREEALALEVARLAPGIVEDARADDLRKLLWLLEGAELVISPDTGPLHMARALEVPVVGLFGATNPKRSGPYGKGTGLVVDGYSRFPGEEYGAEPELRRDGMARITPEMVMEKVALARV